MNCNECKEQLSDYVDGELEFGAQTKIENHLADCEPCRAMRDDLLQIVHFSRQLPLHTPSAAVWTRIQEQIESEPPKTLGMRVKAWWGRVQLRDFSLSIPQMAIVTAAFLVMVAVSAIVFRSSQNLNSQIPAFQQQFQRGNETRLDNNDLQDLEQRINELKGTVEQRRSFWSQDLQISYDKNMISVDQLLSECRQELDNNPADETCRELLHNAYKEKMRVLEGFVNF